MTKIKLHWRTVGEELIPLYCILYLPGCDRWVRWTYEKKRANVQSNWSDIFEVDPVCSTSCHWAHLILGEFCRSAPWRGQESAVCEGTVNLLLAGMLTHFTSLWCENVCKNKVCLNIKRFSIVLSMFNKACDWLFVNNVIISIM